jgi:hypothetical protein
MKQSAKELEAPKKPKTGKEEYSAKKSKEDEAKAAPDLGGAGKKRQRNGASSGTLRTDQFADGSDGQTILERIIQRSAVADRCGPHRTPPKKVSPPSPGIPAAIVAVGFPVEASTRMIVPSP